MDSFYKLPALAFHAWRMLCWGLFRWRLTCFLVLSFFQLRPIDLVQTLELFLENLVTLTAITTHIRNHHFVVSLLGLLLDSLGREVLDGPKLHYCTSDAFFLCLVSSLNLQARLSRRGPNSGGLLLGGGLGGLWLVPLSVNGLYFLPLFLPLSLGSVHINTLLLTGCLLSGLNLSLT
jgi:hypothetical protein